MGMCTSGSLSICATAGTNRSIATAVIGTTSGSLSVLSVSAGKSTPHSMLEFYGYNPPENIGVNLTHVSSTLSDNGVTNKDCLTQVTQPDVGSNYDLSITYHLLGNGNNTCALFSVICNLTTTYSCLAINLNGMSGIINNVPTFNITCNDCVCLCTSTGRGDIGGWAESCAHITCVEKGVGSIDGFYIGTPYIQCAYDCLGK